MPDGGRRVHANLQQTPGVRTLHGCPWRHCLRLAGSPFLPCRVPGTRVETTREGAFICHSRVPSCRRQALGSVWGVGVLMHYQRWCARAQAHAHARAHAHAHTHARAHASTWRVRHQLACGGIGSTASTVCTPLSCCVHTVCTPPAHRLHLVRAGWGTSPPQAPDWRDGDAPGQLHLLRHDAGKHRGLQGSCPPGEPL